jgi:chemotaxis protein histidine kinase CheA
MDPTINQINQLIHRIEELQEELEIANDIIDNLFEEIDSGELILSEDIDFLAEAEKKKWIQKALKKDKEGELHKDLKVKKGEKIPEKKLEKAAHSKGKKGQRARLAMKLREYSKKKKKLNEAAENLAQEYAYLSNMLKQQNIEPQKAEAIKARLKQIQGQLTPSGQGFAGGNFDTKTIQGQY